MADRVIQLKDGNDNLYTMPRYRTEDVTLADKTWTKSSQGMYYLTTANAYEVPDVNKILSLTVVSFGSLKSTDIVTPYINGNNKITFMSPTDTFHADAKLTLLVLYI